MFLFMRMEDLQMLMNSGEYLDLVQNIKQEIQSAQYRAALNVNRELICLYYDIGSAINEHKTWGNKFIENLATDIRLAFPEAKGYSVRNLKYMAKFATTYPDREFVQTVSAQTPWMIIPLLACCCVRAKMTWWRNMHSRICPSPWVSVRIK